MRSTHTLATLAVPAAMFDLVAAQLRAAGYDHAFDGAMVDMTGIGLIAAAEPDPRARPIETAPRDGRMLRLLVEFEEHATEDSPNAAWTIGAHNGDNDPDSRWQFAGWCWTHDHFTEGKGRPVGWLPMLGHAFQGPQEHAAPARDGGDAALLELADVWESASHFNCGVEGCHGKGALLSCAQELRKAITQPQPEKAP